MHQNSFTKVSTSHGPQTQLPVIVSLCGSSTTHFVIDTWVIDLIRPTTTVNTGENYMCL